ncbi:multicopper oxidase domain-containing protein [soil metagenome]
MRKANVQLRPGRKTEMWTYGGSYPGPTIRRPAGSATNVTFKHKLPAKVGELTVHLHGGHNKPASDGYPGGLTHSQPRSLYCDITPDLSRRESGNEYLIKPGDSRTYTFEGMEDGEPERGAFQWYHDHRLDHASTNSWHGLTGMWITDDPAAEDPLNLPTGRRDVPLMITDRKFDKHNQLTDPFRFQGKPPLDQVTGNQILVNGAPTPHASVKAQRYRLRLLNTSSFRSYNFHMGGLEMVQICSEAGLLPRALKQKEILIGPAQRVEIVVDFASVRGKRVKLVSSKRSGPKANKLGSKPYIGDLMEFRVGSKHETDTTADLATLKGLAALRALPQWAQDIAAENPPPAPSFNWKLQIGGGVKPKWLINGKTFDPAFAQPAVALGDVVVWKLQNTTGIAHLLHLHHTDWYMLSRNGHKPPNYERCLKETFFLDPGDEVVIAGKMSGGANPLDPAYLGKYVVHCHMLDHEDHGLMSQFEVVS